MRIAIFGMGYVGAVSAACLARDGHEVVGVDIDSHKLDLLRRGHSPIVEEGIQELTAQVVQAGRLTVTDDVSEAIRRSEVSFICVGTPSSRNGSQDLAAVRNVARQIGEALALTDHYHTVVLRSTVKPGTTLELVGPTLESASGKRVGEGFGLAFQPEFLREGSSIKDYDHPPFTVVGADSERTLDQVKPIFEHLPCEFVGTGIGTAEMVKYACNAFHALKIVFANEVGRLSQSLGLDSREVMELVTRDRQLNISPAYLRPGFAFGGSCLPKDLRAVLYMAKEQDTELPMLGSLIPSTAADRPCGGFCPGQRQAACGPDRPEFQERHRRHARKPPGGTGGASDRQGHGPEDPRPQRAAVPGHRRQPALHRGDTAPYRLPADGRLPCPHRTLGSDRPGAE
nr:nucleotide sugar dehydrogenase [Ectothiorhodospira sp. PHS-1]